MADPRPQGRQWTAQEFTSFAIALLGSAYGWQTRLAERLGVAPRTVRRWAAGDVPLPPGVQAELEELARLKAGERMGFPCRDDWIVGEGAPDPATGHRREYVVHVAPPRFVARAVGLEEDGTIQYDEEPADPDSGPAYRADPDTLLCEIEWIDPAPGGPQLARLLEAAADALAATLEE